MLAGIATFIATYLLVGAIAYLLSDNITFREVLTHTGTFVFMMFLGWIPSVVVLIDLDEAL